MIPSNDGTVTTSSFIRCRLAKPSSSSRSKPGSACSRIANHSLYSSGVVSTRSVPRAFCAAKSAAARGTRALAEASSVAITARRVAFKPDSVGGRPRAVQPAPQAHAGGCGPPSKCYGLCSARHELNPEELVALPPSALRVAIVALLATLAAPRPAQPVTDEAAAAVRAVGALYLELASEDSLFLRLKQGLPIDRLPETSLARAEERAARARALVARLEAVPEARLQAEDRLSREMLRHKLHFEADAPRDYWLGFEVTPYASPLGPVHQAFRALPLRTKADTDRYLALLGQYPAFVASQRGKLRGQAERGIRLPKDELTVVAAYLQGALDPGPASPFAVDAARLSPLAPDAAAAFEKSRADGAAAARRALQGLLTQLRDQAKGAPEAVGLGQYPGGRAAYETLVRRHTTLDVTPEEVHRIGLEEVKHLESRMAEVRRTLGFTGTAAAFREALRQDEHFRARTPEQVGERLMAYDARVRPRLDAFFEVRPRAEYGVKRLDPEREAALTFGIYEPPSPTEPRGLYRFNGSKLDERSLLTAGPLAYHELAPGHHFQIALANENASIPAFRRELWDTAYVEGWGEYASGLAEEMGMYADPYDLYGRLSMDMFLSVRLVVDTGLNALGWPRAQATAYMREHLMESDTQIETESLRYSTDIPGQALAYKMGSRALRDMRRKAQAALGERFDVRRFHACILGSGSLPLATLASKVDGWITAERDRKAAR